MAKTKQVRVTIARKKKKQPPKQKEMTRLGAALRALGGYGGGALGSMVGQGSAGSNLGNKLGAAVSRWLGSGDYSVGSNTVVQRANGSIPSMHKSDQSIVVRHKEFLGEIRGSTEFTIRRTLSINPGLEETFPWASTVAGRFQEYRIKGMVYHYVPTSGTAISSSSAALGTVMIQTSYRASDTPPSSKSEMLNEYWASEGRACDDFCHPIECDPKENPYNLHYIRSGAITDGTDQLLYDLGTTWVATSGMQSDDQIIGDLWVTYEIELKKPVISAPAISRNSVSAYQIADVSGSITGATLFNGVLTRGAGSADDYTLVGNVLTIPSRYAGTFYVVVSVEAATTFSAATVVSTQNVTGASVVPFSRSTFAVRNVLGGTGTLNRFFYCIAFAKSQTHSPAVMTIPTVTLTGSAVRTDVWISKTMYPLWT
jgi:hypothetical protein